MTRPDREADGGADDGAAVEQALDKAGVGPAEADESGYRRDDYWRAAQEGHRVDAGAEALRQRDALSADRNDSSSGNGASEERPLQASPDADEPDSSKRRGNA